MSSPQQPIHLRLTEEQQALIHRITGEHAQMLELTPDPGDGSGGEGRGLHFGWRVSVDTGIPRQQWVTAHKPPPAPAGEGPTT